MFDLNNPDVLGFFLTLLVFFLVYLYLEFSLKKYKAPLIQLKNLFINKNAPNLKYLKKLKKTLRLLFLIFLLGIFLNKILVILPFLSNLFHYSIIKHQLLDLKLINLINTIFVFFFFNSLIKSIIYFIYLTYPKDKVEELSLDDIIKYLGSIISFVAVLGVLGINLTLLIPIAGALGIGAGFALQDLLKNLIAGLIILFGKIVKKGDYIKFENFEGYVKEINLRTTIIKTPSNEEVIVPNSMITENPLVNYSLTEPIVRIDIPFGISYSSNIKKVFEIAKKVGEKYSEGDVQVIFKGFGNSALEFNLRIWINIRKILPIRVKSKIYTELFNEFKENKIEIPFNQLDIWFKNELKIKKE